MSSKRYPDEFKIEAVKQVVDRGHSVHDVAGVRHQSFWVQSSFNLREYLAHLVRFIMRRTCGVASAESRVFRGGPGNLNSRNFPV